jgi:TIR domain
MNWNIFISYSRTDDQPLVGDPIGWVERFQRDLKVAVSQAIGLRQVEIWTDKRVDGNEYFADTIDEVTAQSSLLVPIISNAYLLDESGWLRRERESFVRGAVESGGLRLGNKSRICPILRHKVNKDDPRFPEEIRALNLKHKFYDDEGHDLRGDLYRDRITDVADTIRSMLEELEKHKASVPSSKRSSKLVYLATATPDVEFERRKIAEELTRKGYSILPDGRLPVAEDEMQEAIDKDLSSCGISVHLVGANLDQIPKETSRAIELQHAAAQYQSAKGLIQVVWTPGYLDLDKLMDAVSGAAKSFYANLKEPKGFEYSRENFERLLSFVLSKLERIQSPGSNCVDVDLPPGVMRKAYFVCDFHDRDVLKPIEEKFLARDWWVEFPPETDDEKNFKELSELHMRDCQAFVIYYGSANKLWVDVQRVEYRQANLKGDKRHAPLYSKWIYRGPKESADKRQYGPKEDYRLEGDFQNPFTDEFIDRLTTTRPAPKSGNA